MSHHSIDQQPFSPDLYRQLLVVGNQESLFRFVGFIVLVSTLSAVASYVLTGI